MERNLLTSAYSTIKKNVKKGISYARVAVCYDRILEESLNKERLEASWRDNNVSCISDLKLKSATIDVSIIVPLYNSEKFLPTCLNSLINQKTNYRYEIILVNDGSTDNTQKVAEEYANKYPGKVLVISQKNQGISAARNTGLENSNGKYIGFADHDDWVSENYIEKLVTIAENENADIVKCSFALVRNGKIVQQKTKEKIIISGGMKEKLYEYSSYIWGGVYRRELLNSVRFPVGYWYEDMITRILLYQQAKIFCDIGECLYYKLDHANNASKKVWSNKEYKCLEQVYLPKSPITDCKKIGIKQDCYMYQCILLEYSSILVSRISNLPIGIQRQAFLYARSILQELYRPEFSEELLPKWRKWNTVIMEGKFEVWRALAGT